MRTNMLTVVAVAAVMLVVLPCLAQSTEGGGAPACSPEGTWYGSNSQGESYLFSVTPTGGGRGRGRDGWVIDGPNAADPTANRLTYGYGS